MSATKQDESMFLAFSFFTKNMIIANRKGEQINPGITFIVGSFPVTVFGNRETSTNYQL